MNPRIDRKAPPHGGKPMPHHAADLLNDKRKRVSDGIRTRDPQDHNLVLCQLSYNHRHCRFYRANRACQ
jgi:hypothetical protein